jgi:hypothetical protein
MAGQSLAASPVGRLAVNTRIVSGPRPGLPALLSSPAGLSCTFPPGT